MPRRPALRPAPLRFGALVAVMFFTVSGGPFGLEGLVGSVGPRWAVALLLGIPLLYSVPEILLVGELASMLPAEGGYYVWVRRAFGRRWGFFNGWVSWTYSLLDMAIYPVLCLQYARFFVPSLGDAGAWLVALGLIWGATWLNVRGTSTVGAASKGFAAAVVAPFAVLAGAASVRWATHGGAPVSAAPGPAVGAGLAGALGIGISQTIWNYRGWDNASTIGGEIENASRSYPRALLRALPLVTAVYLVSIVPTLAVTDWTLWEDGAWPRLASRVAGPWIAGWVALAGMASAFALFNALLLAYSRVPMVMAQDGLLPAALGRTDHRGTPRNAIVVSAVAYSIFALLPFGGLLAGDVLLYTGALALEFAALIRLRRAEPALRGSFRLPLGVPVLVLLAALPVTTNLAAVAIEVRSREIGLPGVITAAALASAGPAVYALRRLRTWHAGRGS